MKKFLSLTVALAMTVAMVPATAFAKSDMKISRTVTVESDDLLFDGSSIGQDKLETKDAPILTLTVDGAFKSEKQTFRLKLTNAEWLSEAAGTVTFEDAAKSEITVVDAGGNSLIDGDTPGGTTAEQAKDALQAKLDEIAGKATDAKVLYTAEEYYALVEDAIKDGEITETSGTHAITTFANLLEYLPVAVKAAAEKATADDGAADEWAALEAPTEGYLDAKLVAETAAKDITDAKKATLLAGLETALDTLNSAVEGDANADRGVFSSDEVMAMIDEAISKNTTAAKVGDDVIAAIKETTDITVATGIAGALGAFETAVEAYAGPFIAAKTSATILENKKSALDRAIKAFLAKVNTEGTPAGDALKADDVLKAYKEGNLAAFREYLAGKNMSADNIEVIIPLVEAYDAAKEGTATLALEPGSIGEVTIERVTDSIAMITVETLAGLPDDAEISIPLYTKITDGETATVEVDPRDSEFSSDSKTFAKITEGSTDSYIEGTKNFYDGDSLKTITIDENSSGTFEAGKEVSVKISSGFKWGDSKAVLADKIKLLNANGLTVNESTIDVDGNEITFEFTGTKSKDPATLRMAGLVVKEDGADFGTTAKVTVSGGGIDKLGFDVGTYSDFGVTLSTESKALPLIYAGSYDDNDNESLKVIFEETVIDSWLDGRKTLLSLPDGVKFVDVDVKKTEHFQVKTDGTFEQLLRDNIDGSEIEIPANTITITDKKKAKFEVVFTVTADPTFTGDVELKVTGPGISNEELSKAIATVASPLTVKSSTNEVKIDYRNVEVNSITITEAEAGLWEKGDYITLEVEEMQFESGITAEMVSGDMKLEKLDGDNVRVNKKDGTVTIQVKSTSSSTPAEIKIDGIKLYLDRSLPAGSYELSIVGSGKGKEPMNGLNNEKEKDLLFANYTEETKDWDTNEFGKTSFDTDSVVVLDKFIEVVTAGRDQDDSTFTTQIVVPVGADKIMAGTTEITIDSPAYINADGYTMLPVRAVIDALNGVAVVRWDDATKTCTISFGSRIFAMTVGSKVMNMNGVATALLAAPEIKNERIFLPLRDLGYALGLTDSKIKWDAATNTATLN